jgi:branched-chain amino acid transport system substrate-binding protein
MSLTLNTRQVAASAASAVIASAALTAGASDTTPAVSGDVVRIAFVTDLAGPYESVDGKGGAEAIRMAISDKGGKIAGKPVELIALDHRNDPALAAALARRAIDEQGADVIISGVNSETSLAMVDITRERRKPLLVVGAGSSRHTTESCSPYTVQWAYNTTALSMVTANGLIEEGFKRWYFLTADYSFGRELERDTSAAVQRAHGTVIGAARHPHEETEFTSYISDAVKTDANVIAFASGHSAMEGAMKAAHALAADQKPKLAGLLVFIDDVHAMGPEVAGGMYHADSWYWTRDEETRAWSKRFFNRTGRAPSSLHAADFSAAFQYLSAVEAVGSADGDAVMARLKSTPALNDPYLRNGRIRADGLLTHDMYLLQVRSPAEHAAPWDYSKLVATVSGDRAWAPLATGKCASSLK